MPFDSEDGFAPVDPSQWARISALPHIVVYPRPPNPPTDDGNGPIAPGKLADGTDDPNDWVLPKLADGTDDPNDWIYPAKLANGTDDPQDWVFPTSAAGAGAQDASPSALSAAGTAFANPSKPDPFAAFFSTIPASRLGELAWAPPYLSPSPSNNNTASFPVFATSSAPTVPTTWVRPTGGGILDGLAALGPPPPGSPWMPPTGGILDGLAALGPPAGGAADALATAAAPATTQSAPSFHSPSTGLAGVAPAPMPGTVDAFLQGLRAGTHQLAQTAEGLTGSPVSAGGASPAAEPLGWSDLTHPTRIAPKLAYQLAESYPTLAGGVAGGYIGGQIGLAAGPEGAAVGALIGGGLGAAALTAAQTLGPVFAAELQKTPNDPEGAWQRAWRQAEIAGVFSGASWAAFPLRFFKGPVKHLVFQTFGVQPALSVGERVTSNITEGRPATEGIGDAYGQGIVGGLANAAGHALLKQLSRMTPLLRREGDRRPPSPPPPFPPPVRESGSPPADAVPSYREGTFSISDWTGYPDVQKPEGPFRLLQGQEYDAARYAANRVNEIARNADPPRYTGKEIHEIHTVKFGGDPTDPSNKVILPVALHRRVSGWWYRRQRLLERGK